MSYIELKERNLLWEVSQGLLRSPADIRRLVDAGYCTVSRTYTRYGTATDTVVLTCAGAARLNELDRQR